MSNPNPDPSQQTPPTDEAEEKQPWWKDGDAVGSLAATIIVICMCGILTAVTIRVMIWIITGD